MDDLAALRKFHKRRSVRLRAAAWLLRQDLPIDVVDLHQLYPNIRERVQREGRVL